MFAVLILAIITSLVVCPIIIFREWRGVVIGPALTCGKCRFDLRGLPAPITTCPECGCHFVSNPRKLQHELRQRRWFRLGPAIVLPLILIIMLGASLLSRPGRQIMLRVGPASFARAQLILGGTVCDDALSELQTRIVNGTLNSEEKDELIAYLLTRQADQSLEWRTKMGDVLMAARTAGVLSDADWAKFAAGCVSVSAKCRANVRSGDDIPIVITVSPTRVGSVGMPPILGVRASWDSPGDIRGLDAKPLGSAMVPASPTYVTSGPPADVPGEQVVFVNVFLELSGAGWPTMSGTPVSTTSFTLRTRVSPTDVAVVARRKDASATAALKTALRVREATLVTPSNGDPAGLRLELAADSRPTNFAYDVFVRSSDSSDGPEVLMGQIHGTTNSGFSRWTFLQPVPAGLGRGSAAVDVILRPSEKVARESIDMDWYLDEPIEIVGNTLGQETAK